MALDHAGAMIIGGGCSMLIVRILMACMKQAAVKDARMMHFTEAARKQHTFGAKASHLLEYIPQRMRIGLAMGACSVLFGVVPVMLQFLLNSDAATTPSMDPAHEDTGDSASKLALGDNVLARASWTAGKWMIIGSVVTMVRRWGLNKLQAVRTQRPAESDASVAAGAARAAR